MRSRVELPAGVEPLEGEHVQVRWGANRTQSSQRAVGGWLYLTNRRLGFRPTAFDASLSGEQLWVPLEYVVEVGRQKKDLRQFFGGGLRDRLRVVFRGGAIELFVVNRLNAVIEQIRTATSTP